MKRIKRILFTLIIFVSVVILSGCGKKYSSITYSRFTEKMSDELNYSVKDESLSYEGKFEREISAAKGDVVFIFYEFKTDKDAKKYMENNYKKRKFYSYKSNDEYSTVKYTKTGYLYIVQVDNIVIAGSTEKDSSKNEIKKVFKELGY